MQPNFTLKKLSGIRISFPLLLSLFCVLSTPALSQTVTYVNGNLSTGATTNSGVAAPAGKQWSECQNPTGNTTIANTTAGYGAQISANNAVADDITVPAGVSWNVSKITVYAYSTGFTGTTSPFNDLRIRVHNSSPLAGATTIVFGDLTTNRLTASSNTNLLRIFNTVVTPATPPDATRQIWRLEATVNFTLNPGTYWIEYQTGTALASNFVPASTPVGVRTVAGYNALQRLGTVWGAMVDAGQGPASPAPVAMDMPFSVDYTVGPCAGSPATAPTISLLPPTICADSSITMSVTAGTLNAAQNWVWYAGSCGGTPVGTGTSITVTPGTTTTYYVRGEGGCATAPGPCGTRLVTVTPCSCLIPEAPTICEGSTQQIKVKPLGATTSNFTGGAAVTIPSGAPTTTSGNGNPYPSTVSVSGLPTSGAGVYVKSVTLNGFSHTFPGDVDVVLRSPSGTSVVLMSDVGGGTDAVSLNITFDDAAAGLLPATLVSGTFRPTNAAGPDNFPAPGPGSITQINPTLASLSGTGNPNGNWQLFVVDDAGGDHGSLAGWSISFNVVPTATWTPVTGLFRDAGATLAYVAGTSTDIVYAKPATTTTYTANISSGPCTGDNTVTVTVLPRPNITITPATAGCAPANLTASGGISYDWSPGTGLNTTTGPTVTATPTVTTAYTVTGYATNGCTNTASATVNAISTSAVISANVVAGSLNEGFATAIPLPAGWVAQNLSSPVGTTGWFQGNATVFAAQSGPATSYIGANFNNTTGANTISNWLFTPVVILENNDSLVFWSRSAGSFADRLEVRMSTAGSGTNVGTTATSVGDYTNLMLTINPTLTVAGYPTTWTRYKVTVSGLSAPVAGRFAFRYFVTDGGPSGANSNYIGIDEVAYSGDLLTGVCANTVSTISVNITGGVSPFTLVYSNGSTNTTFNNYTSGAPIQVSPAATTTYSIVSVTGANGCPGIGNSGAATVIVTPSPSVTTQPVNASTCDGGNATFSVVAGPTGVTYQWQVSTDGGTTYTNLANGGVYSGVNGSTLSLTAVNTTYNGYRYRVQVSGQCPPSPVNSNAATLSVNVPPTITTAPANATACVGASANFSVVATGNNRTYQWQLSTDGGTTWTNITGATGSSLSISDITSAMNNNRYRVVVTSAPCATTATSTAGVLTVNNLPNVTLATANQLITPGQSTALNVTSVPAAATYSWTLNGSPLSGVTGNTTSANIDGLGAYQVTVTDVNGCTNTSNILSIGGAQSDQLWVYPNPTSGQFQVRLYSTGNPTEERVVSLYNNTGQLIDRRKFILTNVNGPYLRMEFDLRSAASGTYLVKVEDRYSKVVVSGFLIKH